MVCRAVALKQSHGLEETGSYSNCMLCGILEGTGGKASENRIKPVHYLHCFSAVSFKCQHKKLKGKSIGGREQREKTKDGELHEDFVTGQRKHFTTGVFQEHRIVFYLITHTQTSI